MSNEATVFSLTTTEMAAGNVSSTAGGEFVDVATANAAAVTASIDIGLYFLKAKYEGTDGRSRLLDHVDKLKAKIIESAWPAI
jgi:hypothetical protein